MALLALSFGVLGGCSNDPYPPGETAQPIVYAALGDDPKTLDPSVGYDAASDSIICPIYPSYLQYHYLKRDPFTLELGLGAAMPQNAPYTFTTQEAGKTVTQTGEVWTFRIKPGLRFQDDPCFPGGKGREITAADFCYSFRRMADPAIACPILSFLDKKVLGMAAYEAHNRELEQAKRKPDYGFPMEGLQLDPNDPYTFRILLNQRYPQLRFLMALHFTSPLAHEAVEKYGKDLARHPVGCGPFLLADYKPKGHLFLKANPNYREETYPTEGAPGDKEAGLLKDAGKRLPLVKEVHYEIMREGITAWNLFLQGYQDRSGVSQTNYQQVMGQAGQLSEEMKRKGIGLQHAVGVDINYFAFNMADPVVGGYSARNRKLRQAISLVIDAQPYIDLLSQGMGRPAQFIIAPGLFGYDPNYKNPYRQPDLARAKQLLAEAGYPDGIDAKTGERLTLFYDNSLITAAGRQQIGLVVKQIEPLGIHVESRATRYPIFQEKLARGQFQFMSQNWYADYPDPENFVFVLYGPNKKPGPNAANYQNTAYDRLFEQMRVMDDGPQRQEIIEKMRAMVVEDCPWIYMSHSESIALTQPWIENYKPSPLVLDAVKYWNIDGAKRAQLQATWNRPNYWPSLGFALFLALGSLPAAAVIRQRTNRHVRRPQ
ncbi:MAG: ABC-type oligopeptide transport system,periplasmic component [Chthonomonadales bacterium]|nr:ABC-type oligopeptide transport system,periplasmic component [Chthonomonadales bacterium]